MLSLGLRRGWDCRLVVVGSPVGRSVALASIVAARAVLATFPAFAAFGALEACIGSVSGVSADAALVLVPAAVTEATHASVETVAKATVALLLSRAGPRRRWQS